MNILCMANFRAKCSGNFINSLLALGKELRKRRDGIIFMFPLLDNGMECSWADYMRRDGFEVVFYDGHKSQTELTSILFNIIDRYQIRLIHSHFSCLDNILRWNQELHSKVKILYHDHMDYLAELPILPQIRKQLKVARRYRQYGIGVASVMKRKHFWYFLVPQRWYIPNGITFRRNIEVSLNREECRSKLGLKS